MSLTRSSVAQEIAATIIHKHEHHHTPMNLSKSGYKCSVCGRFVFKLTKQHTKDCGFINKEAMIAAGAVRKFRWGKEVHGFSD